MAGSTEASHSGEEEALRGARESGCHVNETRHVKKRDPAGHDDGLLFDFHCKEAQFPL